MNSFQVGIARRDITPPLGTLLFGYPTHRPADKVNDPLSVTALVLRTDDTIAAIISLDLCVIDEVEVEAIRTAIREAVEIPPANITVCATHTHSGPMTIDVWGWAKKNSEYLDNTRTKIVEAVVEAEQNLQSARVGVGVTTTDIGINRREVLPSGEVTLGFNEWGPRDREMTVIRFEGEAGPIAQIVHVGAHPTSRGADLAISRDWPGVMTDRLETVTSTPVLFINGAFGDVAPRTTVGGITGDGTVAAQEVGFRAANDAIQAWKNIKEFHSVELQTLTADFEMPYAPLPPLDEARRQVEEYAGQEEAMGTPGCECNHWNAVLKEHENAPRTSQTFTQTITNFGPVAIVPFAGEIFADIVLRLRKASPFTYTLCAGTTNGSHGYYPTREGRGRGGYEVWVAKAFGPYLLADNIDDVLVSENLNLLQQIKE